MKELATTYYSAAQDFFQPKAILTNYNTYYVYDFILPFVIVFAFYAFLKPLFNIHNSMTEFIQKQERDSNERISLLFDEMTSLIKQNQLEEADKVKSNINFLTNELTDIQKYPRWPFRFLRVLRSYLTFSSLTAVASIVISLLKLYLSP